MRNNLFNTLQEIFPKEKSLFFLTGDTGFNLVEPIFKIAPERSLNVGIAEQNMIGIAAGLCKLGYIPICYAITNFLVQRCYEQIRNDLCLHNHKAILIGTSTGYDNGALGATHHKLDDIGCIKVLPGIRVYSPSGINSLKSSFNDSLKHQNPSFIRISKYKISEDFDFNSINHFIIENNSPSLIISHGKMVSRALEVSNIINDISVFACNLIKPLENEIITKLFSKYSNIFVLEDNFNSGLFNSLCQLLVELKLSNSPKLFSISPKELYDKNVGSSDYLERMHGLDSENIIKFIKKNK